MTDTSGRVSASRQMAVGKRHQPNTTPRRAPAGQPLPVRRQMPHWLPVAAGAVLVWWPVTFVLGLLGSGIWLLVVSMVLAVLAIPSLVVLLVRAKLRSGRRHR